MFPSRWLTSSRTLLYRMECWEEHHSRRFPSRWLTSLRTPLYLSYRMLTETSFYCCRRFNLSYTLYMVYMNLVYGTLYGIWSQNTSVLLDRYYLSFFLYPLDGWHACDTLYRVWDLGSIDRSRSHSKSSLPSRWKDIFAHSTAVSDEISHWLIMQTLRYIYIYIRSIYYAWVIDACFTLYIICIWHSILDGIREVKTSFSFWVVHTRHFLEMIDISAHVVSHGILISYQLARSASAPPLLCFSPTQEQRGGPR